MKIYNLPKREYWASLCLRPLLDDRKLTNIVKSILHRVKTFGEDALFDCVRKFDGVYLNDLKVSQQQIHTAQNFVNKDLKDAIQLAKNNITLFHENQKEDTVKIETTKGIVCWRKSIAIEKIGLYIPAGTTPLFSTVLMLGIPAILAGCKEIILCTPTDKNGTVDPVVLYTAGLVGIDKIFKIGGAQAIAAMAYGTESVPKVYKIFGPGNQYVTKAKELVQLEGIAIDMPAGPSEVLIIADASCNISFVAADLLSQAEHGVDSQVVVVATSDEIIKKIIEETQKQVMLLPRKEIAMASLENSRAIVLKTIKDCFEFSNEYAPEHLIVASDKAENYEDLIVNAGSVFLGNYTCESVGDYASGTNHTLPTNAFAKSYGGVSLDSFVRKVTFQKVSQQGLQNIGKSVELMAEAEQLSAHKNAVTIRLKSLKECLI